MAPLFAAAGTLLLTLALARCWRRRAWGDASEGAEAERKLQQSRVPAVGGIAIAATWAACAIFSANRWSRFPLGKLPGFADDWIDPVAMGVGTYLALGAALALGLVDDHRRGGLAPLPKLLLQALAGAFLGLSQWFPEGLLAAPEASLTALGITAAWSGAGVVAMNAWNTFDNADGAASSLAALGLWPASPLLAAAPLGFLVPNLLLRTRPEPGTPPRRGDSRAYLGDGGSHLLGMALLLSPGAWPVFLLPILDLLRVGVLRCRLALAPWHGDRRHLAHRLQAAGVSPIGVPLILGLIAIPALWRPDPWGAVATALLFVVAVVFTPSSR